MLIYHVIILLEGQGAEVVAAAEIVIPIIDEITDHMTTIGEDQGIDSTDRG